MHSRTTNKFEKQKKPEKKTSKQTKTKAEISEPIKNKYRRHKE